MRPNEVTRERVWVDIPSVLWVATTGPLTSSPGPDHSFIPARDPFNGRGLGAACYKHTYVQIGWELSERFQKPRYRTRPLLELRIWAWRLKIVLLTGFVKHDKWKLMVTHTLSQSWVDKSQSALIKTAPAQLKCISTHHWFIFKLIWLRIHLP